MPRQQADPLLPQRDGGGALQGAPVPLRQLGGLQVARRADERRAPHGHDLRRLREGARHALRYGDVAARRAAPRGQQLPHAQRLPAADALRRAAQRRRAGDAQGGEAPVPVARVAAPRAQLRHALQGARGALQGRGVPAGGRVQQRQGAVLPALHLGPGHGAAALLHPRGPLRPARPLAGRHARTAGLDLHGLRPAGVGAGEQHRGAEGDVGRAAAGPRALHQAARGPRGEARGQGHGRGGGEGVRALAGVGEEAVGALARDEHPHRHARRRPRAQRLPAVGLHLRRGRGALRLRQEPLPEHGEPHGDQLLSLGRAAVHLQDRAHHLPR
mmetsp:Transcript_20377/g.61897  ORF Transcript_20377/g.61897 Transcript_20377/m.61897 type:complete len:329 (-) Transcript_20377:1428-2414(-)